jgi:hypothetical protein
VISYLMSLFMQLSHLQILDIHIQRCSPPFPSMGDGQAIDTPAFLAKLVSGVDQT